MALRDVLSRAAEAARPRNWTDHVSTLEARLTGLQAERVTVEATLQRVSASAFAEPENRALATERDTLADRLAGIARDVDLTERALNGARLRIADDQLAEATAVRQAKRDRVTGILSDIQVTTARMDSALDTLATDAERIQLLRENLAAEVGSEVAGTIRLGVFCTYISHRLSVIGFDRSLALSATDKPTLKSVLPELNYVLKFARLN